MGTGAAGNSNVAHDTVHKKARNTLLRALSKRRIRYYSGKVPQSTGVPFAVY